MDSIPQKRCSRCGEIKALSEFHRNKRLPDGHVPICKPCAIAKTKEWYRTHREHSKQYHKEYEQKHRKQTNARHREWARIHKERRKEIQRRYTERHREEINRRARESRDPAVERERYKRYSKTARAKLLHAIREQNRRACKKWNGGEFSEQEWIELCDRFGNICLACGRKEKLTIDHVIPLSLGGMNNIDNIQPLCLSCNLSKHDKIVDYRK